jgi:hypothetical protein
MRPPAAFALALALLGCGDEGPGTLPMDAAMDMEAGADVGPPGPVVSDFFDDDGCSTTVVLGLSQQLVDELECLMPGMMGPIDVFPEVELGSAAFPFMQAMAALALGRAAEAFGPIRVNSSLRTLPQQFLLYQWFLDGRCGISLAARPGRSNHESGLAVDLAERGAARVEMEAQGFTWLGPDDPVHYDYTGGGAVDLRMFSVLAFQRLWNLNRPGDPIEEDGAYGPQTEARLSASPADGFVVGASCGSAP